VSDDSTAALQGQLWLARDRLTRHARRPLHGPYARLGPLAQTDDVVQQRYLKALRDQGRFWANPGGQPVRALAEFFGRASAWLRDVLCDLMRQACGRSDGRPAALLLGGGPSDADPRYEPSSSTLDGEKLRRWTELHQVRDGSGRISDGQVVRVSDVQGEIRGPRPRRLLSRGPALTRRAQLDGNTPDQPAPDETESGDAHRRAVQRQDGSRPQGA
jgi:DNA-directed RNA polymerase specialized sigma24 family protein